MDRDIENLIYSPSSPYVQAIVKYSERVAPGKNKYIVMSSLDNGKYFNGIKERICTAEFNSKEFWDHVGSLDSYKRIIVNYPNKSTAWLLNHLPKNSNVKIIWVFWSGELYNLPKFLSKVYQPFSRKFVLNLNFFAGLFIEELRSLVSHRITYHKLSKSYNCFTHFASIVKGDFENAKEMLKVSPKYIDFSFQSYTDMFSSLEKIGAVGNKIMIGHSGAPENNHYEAFHLVKNLNLPNPVLCPLSYGNKKYIQAVLREGEQLFGQNIEFLTEFIPKESYYKKLEEVGFAIFNLNIQQGFGNIIGLIWLGVKVFLKESNSILSQLKEWGIVVFSIENDLTPENLTIPLTKDQILNNKSIIESLFSEENVERYYRNILHI